MYEAVADLVVRVVETRPVAYAALTVGGIALSAFAAHGALSLLSRVLKLRI